MNYNYLQLPQKGSSALSINFSDIIYLEGDSNYTVFHMVGGSKITSSRTMLFHIQNYLNEGFLRIHKAYCVNRDFIKSYDTTTTLSIFFYKTVQLSK